MLPQKNTIQARTKSLLLQDWFCTQSDQVHHKVWYSFIVLFIPDNHQTSKEGRLLRRCADDWASGVCCILIFIQLEMKLIRIVTCFQPHLCHFAHVCHYVPVKWEVMLFSTPGVQDSPFETLKKILIFNYVPVTSNIALILDIFLHFKLQ